MSSSTVTIRVVTVGGGDVPPTEYLANRVKRMFPDYNLSDMPPLGWKMGLASHNEATRFVVVKNSTRLNTLYMWAVALAEEEEQEENEVVFLGVCPLDQGFELLGFRFRVLPGYISEDMAKLVVLLFFIYGVFAACRDLGVPLVFLWDFLVIIMGCFLWWL